MKLHFQKEQKVLEACSPNSSGTLGNYEKVLAQVCVLSNFHVMLQEKGDRSASIFSSTYRASFPHTTKLHYISPNHTELELTSTIV